MTSSSYEKIISPGGKDLQMRSGSTSNDLSILHVSLDLENGGNERLTPVGGFGGVNASVTTMIMVAPRHSHKESTTSDDAMGKMIGLDMLFPRNLF